MGSLTSPTNHNIEDAGDGAYGLKSLFMIAYFSTRQGVKIRGLLLCNPNNPLGVIYSKDLLQGCLQFAAR